MKKLILMVFAAVCLALLPMTGFAADQTIDTTHLNLDPDGTGTFGCAECHFSLDLQTGLEIVAKDTCVGCHKNNTGANYTDGAAPYVNTHMGLECINCHNPHVSLQYSNTGVGGKTPLVAGGYTAVDATTPGEITFTINTGTNYANLTGDWKANPEKWFAKTGNGARGLVMWVDVPSASGNVNDTNTPNHDESLDSHSFEVIAAAVDGTTITVKDREGYGATWVTPNAWPETGGFELHYGQLMAKAVNPSIAVDYRDADPIADAVVFPATDNPNIFVSTGGTNDGICQKCHTDAAATTKHWNSLGNDGHNVATKCVQCHKHDNTSLPAVAFSPGGKCIDCHLNYPNPPSSGAHAIHANRGDHPTNPGYGFACARCHKGGMNEYVDPNDSVDIGFNMAGLGNTNYSGLHSNYDGTPGTFPDPALYGTSYAAQNDGTVSSSGGFTCSNVYCHSSGQSIEKGCLTTEIQGKTFTSPKWDGTSVDADGNSCNNCHPQVWPATNTNTHYQHVVVRGVPCYACHRTTTSDGVTITNKLNHINGTIDVVDGATWSGKVRNFTFNPVTPSCTFPNPANSCHIPNTWTPEPATCVVGPADAPTYATPNVSPVANATCQPLDGNTLLITNLSTDPDQVDPIKNAALGGGHNNTVGLQKMYYFHVANLDQQDYIYTGLDTYPSNGTVVHYWPTEDLYVDPADGRPYAYFNLTISDNSPGSLSNQFAEVPTPDGGPGWDKDDGNIPALPGWRRCVMDTPDPTLNSPGHLNYTVAALGGNKIEITDQSTDPDYNDLSKGNDGTTNAYILAFYFTDDDTPGGTPGGGVNGGGSFLLTDVPNPRSLGQFTYDDGDLDYTSREGARLGWYTVTIYDNHYMIDTTSPVVTSGWQSIDVIP